MGRLDFGGAVLGDAISYVGQAVGILWLVASGRPTIAAAFFIMETTSLAAALQFWQVRPPLNIPAGGSARRRQGWSVSGARDHPVPRCR